MAELNLKLSRQGQVYKAPSKKFAETVLLVPFFGAERTNLRRHIDLLNELGYDCAAFELRDEWLGVPESLFKQRHKITQGHFGLKHIWTDQIMEILDEIPGPKILFSFSNPSASAIEAIARRKAKDISALIADGGPSGQLWHSMVSFFTHEQPLKTYPLKAAAAALTAFLWHPRFLAVIHDDLNQFPKGFRILSIRGWKDKLISPKMIDMVFEPHKQLEWQKLSLPHGEHLNGLKDFPEEYRPPVIQFLKEVSTPV